MEYSGKALREKDFLVLDNYQRLRIPKGSLSTTEKMTYAALIDAVEEGDEAIIVKIKTVSNPDVHIGNGAVVIINDIYPPPSNTDEPQGEIVNKDISIDPLFSDWNYICTRVPGKSIYSGFEPCILIHNAYRAL